MSKRKKMNVRWSCARCGHRHKWKWTEDEFETCSTAMECEKCDEDTLGVVMKEAGRPRSYVLVKDD